MPAPFGDVVVLLPGILGSVLQKDGKDVWALSGSAFLRALASLGGSIQQLELKGDDPNVDDLDDGITAHRLLSDVHLIPGFWKIDGYTKVADYLIDAFGLVPAQNYFEFPYDWRRDNRVSARRLARSVHSWLGNWRQKSGNSKAKLILIAHSMGGLVSRCFLELLDGWRDTRMLITFGTPFRGSLKALKLLSGGFPASYGPLPIPDLDRMLRSLTSVYQLLPIYPCVDPGNGKLARVSETPQIPNLVVSRAAAAIQFHRDIQGAVESHEHDDAYQQGRYEVLPIVGTFQETLQSAVIQQGKLKLLPTISGEDLSGDGTVPRVSAVPIGADSQISGRSIACPHSSLQNADDSLTQIEYWLSGITIDDQRFKAFLRLAEVGLALEDAYPDKDEIRFRVRSSDPSRELTISVSPVGSGQVIAKQTVVPTERDWTSVVLGRLAPDLYRLEVAGAGVQAASDIFLVLGSLK